ncbi:MAG: Mbeg1-like protein [Clostridium sp.]
MLGKIRTLIPKSSVAGMMLERGEKYKVVSSCDIIQSMRILVYYFLKTD